MKTEYAINILNALKVRQKQIKTLCHFGVNLREFDEGVLGKFEESIALLFCNDNKEHYSLILSKVIWWLYHEGDKIITLKNGQEIDVNEVNNFVNWINVHFTDTCGELHYYPGNSYQRLFNQINESGLNPTISQMTDIINVVKEDFF